MHRWLLGSAVLTGCLSEAPTDLEGEMGFAVQDAILVPCRTTTGKQMVFGLLRSGKSCSGNSPRKRTCEGLTSLLSYPFACQTGAIPMTITASDATLVWIGDVHSLDDLTTATVTSVEHRTCGGPPQTMVGDVVILDQGRSSVALDFRFDEMFGEIDFIVCR